MQVSFQAIAHPLDLPEAWEALRALGPLRDARYSQVVGVLRYFHLLRGEVQLSRTSGLLQKNAAGHLSRSALKEIYSGVRAEAALAYSHVMQELAFTQIADQYARDLVLPWPEEKALAVEMAAVGDVVILAHVGSRVSDGIKDQAGLLHRLEHSFAVLPPEDLSDHRQLLVLSDAALFVEARIRRIGRMSSAGAGWIQDRTESAKAVIRPPR